MPSPTDDFRCAVTSSADAEPLEATASEDERWLLVERPGDWGQSVDLAHDDPAVRVQWIRRPGRTVPGDGVRVFWAERGGAGFAVRTGTVADRAAAGHLRPADLTPYDAPLVLVCTHGRRDVCCAEQGRPVAADLALAFGTEWPEATWETSHLGGHRFAPTLLVLPAGLLLGRVDSADPAAPVREVLAGRWPADVVRGRAGDPVRHQAAEAFVRRTLEGAGLVGVQLGDVQVVDDDGTVVTVLTPEGLIDVRVEPGEPVLRRASCAKPDVKPTPTWVCARA